VNHVLRGVGSYGVDSVGSLWRGREVAVAVAELVELEVDAAHVQAWRLTQLHLMGHCNEPDTPSQSTIRNSLVCTPTETETKEKDWMTSTL
jgi:hypothetical protein